MHPVIASYLLQERDKGKLSKWYNYINVLPKQYEEVPVFWDETQKAELTGSMALNKIDNRLTVLVTDYSTLCQVCRTLYNIHRLF